MGIALPRFGKLCARPMYYVHTPLSASASSASSSPGSRSSHAMSVVAWWVVGKEAATRLSSWCEGADASAAF